MILASTSLAVSKLLIAALVFIVIVIVYTSRPKGGPKFKVGQEVVWITTMRTGKILQVREDDMLYVVEFTPDEIRAIHEERLQCT